jgi:hypothetical protein
MRSPLTSNSCAAGRALDWQPSERSLAVRAFVMHVSLNVGDHAPPQADAWIDLLCPGAAQANHHDKTLPDSASSPYPKLL